MIVWDGASPGTAVNVLQLAIANKPCVICDLARGSMATTYNVGDWCAMLRDAGPDIRRAKPKPAWRRTSAWRCRDDVRAVPAGSTR